MADFTVFAKNDFAHTVTLVEVESPSADIIPVESGTVTVFFTDSDDPLAEVVTVNGAPLNATAAYTGAGGVWLVTAQASQFPPDEMDEAFPTGVIYMAIERTNDVRAYLKGAYKRKRKARVAS